MRASQEGDSVAYTAVLTVVTPLVRRMAARRWTGSDEADDVVQDVLLSLHQVRHTYDPDRPFLPWLMAIARNRLADTQRRQVRRAKGEVAVDILPERHKTRLPRALWHSFANYAFGTTDRRKRHWRVSNADWRPSSPLTWSDTPG